MNDSFWDGFAKEAGFGSALTAIGKNAIPAAKHYGAQAMEATKKLPAAIKANPKTTAGVMGAAAVGYGMGRKKQAGALQVAAQKFMGKEEMAGAIAKELKKGRLQGAAGGAGVAGLGIGGAYLAGRKKQASIIDMIPAKDLGDSMRKALKSGRIQGAAGALGTGAAAAALLNKKKKG